VHEPGGARGSRFDLPDAPPVIGQAFLAGVAVILFGPHSGVKVMR